jgi:hypothetical protein
MGLTTFTPTTISCAEIRVGAKKRIAAKKTSMGLHRFVLHILFP